MIKLADIKLIIWDLDDTFWSGTISEGSVHIPSSHIKLIKDLTDRGIVNSICSKNDRYVVERELSKDQLENYFVFSSINWNPKGNRVKSIVEDMNLRMANVLFLDDNPANCNEVAYYCQGIKTAGPEFIPDLMKQVSAMTIKDSGHKRLKQYQILETKKSEEKTYTSNEKFLIASNIQVDLKTDCLEHLERIHELLLRSNQLNFTKLRESKDDLRELLLDPLCDSAYIRVRDRFGDYGITGFYALKDNKLVHFTFSCRILGMGVEQYIYNYLGRPELIIHGEVASDLSSDKIPEWINRQETTKENIKHKTKTLNHHCVLIKGPCDLFQVYPYISQTDLFDTEFTYTTDSGITIESTGHTTNIVEAVRLSTRQKDLVCQEVPFADAGMYNDQIVHNDYKIVFISILSDANLGVYRRKETGECFAYLESSRPITDRYNWDKYISGEYDARGMRFNKDILEDFAEKYEFLGANSPEQIVDNLLYIRQHLSDSCMLVIMLGGEMDYKKNTSSHYENRHLLHKRINTAIREAFLETAKVRLLDVNKYLVDQSSFYDHFNHYIKPVYYGLAGDMVELINEATGEGIKERSKLLMAKIRLKEIFYPVYHGIRKMVKGVNRGK